MLTASGWNAPKKSYQLVRPHGDAASATNDEINLSFSPTPDYAGIAAAAGAGNIHALGIGEADALEGVLKDAIAKVLAGRTAVVDCNIVQRLAKL